jgi:hypothetical protein
LSERILKFEKKFSPFEFGFNALAPLMYLFFSSLYDNYHGKNVYFLSRDGFFLKELYEAFLKSKNIQVSNIHYLLISRRAVLGAVKKTPLVLNNILFELGTYNGTFSNLIFHRFGIDKVFLYDCEIEDFEISTIKDLEKAEELLNKHIDIVNQYADIEREAFLQYLDSIKFMDNRESVLVDLGFSGTIQNYLYQITGQKLIGEYFVTTDKVIKIENSENILKGYFADKIDYSHNLNDNVIFRYSLILESYLTSNEGQLLKFKKSGHTVSPVFKEEINDISIQQEITEGIKGYFYELDMVEYDFLEYDTSYLKELSTFMFEYIIENRLLNERLESMLWIDDDFTGVERLNILDILKDRGV